VAARAAGAAAERGQASAAAARGATAARPGAGRAKTVLGNLFSPVLTLFNGGAWDGDGGAPPAEQARDALRRRAPDCGACREEELLLRRERCSALSGGAPPLAWLLQREAWPDPVAD